MRFAAAGRRPDAGDHNVVDIQLAHLEFVVDGDEHDDAYYCDDDQSFEDIDQIVGPDHHVRCVRTDRQPAL
ncbi:hypothetical protein [Nakamurella multipartita]|uniref:hypothetical protein n=1 Tax=Nakamurella multipartita TaxID=53461 RepID=UPI00019E870B|nr:hypothetical protein [Nakamurella multipartita]